MAEGGQEAEEGQRRRGGGVLGEGEGSLCTEAGGAETVERRLLVVEPVESRAWEEAASAGELADPLSLSLSLSLFGFVSPPLPLRLRSVLVLLPLDVLLLRLERLVV